MDGKSIETPSCGRRGCLAGVFFPFKKTPHLLGSFFLKYKNSQTAKIIQSTEKMHQSHPWGCGGCLAGAFFLSKITLPGSFLKVIIPAKPQPEINRFFDFSWFFVVFFGVFGVYIIPNWLIKVPGHFPILFGWFQELRFFSQNLVPETS